MDNRGQTGIGIFVIAFIAVIVCIALFGSITNTVGEMTNKIAVTNESDALTTCVMLNASNGGWDINESNAACNITVTNAPSGWKTTGCPLTSVAVVDSAGGTAYTVDTDYVVFDSTGIVQMLDTEDTRNITANTTFTTYTYCADGYNTDSGSRSIASMILIFAALAIALFVFARIKLDFLK